MNAIINNEMTLEEKLEAIDQALLNAVEPAFVNKNGEVVTYPVDPASLVMCDGCQ